MVLACCVGACSGEADRSAPAPSPPSTRAPADGMALPPGFDLPLPEGAVVRHSQARAGRAQVTLTTETAADEVVAFYTHAFEQRRLRVEPQLDFRAREPGHHREVLRAVASGDERMPTASASIERGPSGLTRVSLSQRRAPAPSFDSELEPRAWRVIRRPPVPAPPGQPVTDCTAAIRRACEGWSNAGGPDALDCAMDHRGVCVLSEDEAYLRRSVEDARERLLAAHRAHDSVATEGARAETEAQLRLERLAADAVAFRAMSRDVDFALVGPLLELIQQTRVRVPDARPVEWFRRPGETQDDTPPAPPGEIPDWMREQ